MPTKKATPRTKTRPAAGAKARRQPKGDGLDFNFGANVRHRRGGKGGGS